MFTIVVVLLLLELFLCYKHIQYAVVVFIIFGFLIPPYIDVNVAGINLNSFNLSCAILCLGTFFSKEKKKGLEVLGGVTFIFALSLYILSFFASFGWMPLGTYVKDSILYFFEFFALVCFFCKVSFSRKDIEVITKSLLLVGSVVSLYAVFNYITGLNPYMLFVNLSTDTRDMTETYMNESRGVLSRRASSTFWLPLALGQFMSLLQLFILYIYRDDVFKKLFFFFLFFIPIVLSGSRSCIFPSLLMLLISFIYAKVYMKIGIISAFFLLLPIGWFIVPSEYKTTIEATIFVWDEKKSDKAGIRGSGVNMRKEQLKSAFFIVKDCLLLGKGIGYVKEKGKEHPEMLGYEGFLLQSIIELGLIGTTLFLLYFSFLMVYAQGKIKDKRETPYVVGYCIGYYISIFLTGVVYTSFCYFMLFYILLLKDMKKKIDIKGELYYYHPIRN